MIGKATRLATIAGALALTVGAAAAPTPAAADTVIGGNKTIPIYDHQMRTGTLEFSYQISSSGLKGKYCLYDVKGNGDGVYFRVVAVFSARSWPLYLPNDSERGFKQRNTLGKGSRVCGNYDMQFGRTKSLVVIVANTDNGKLYGSRTTRIK
ncbi:hypothetical protein [Kribbella shirazensis]|uniref:Uncharacterized protein n=1 Tax=Kribbella shirazensis TaxID=1105143 RepID=A0A7X5V8A2_9ACTN|nr:hypothetical protein [Kribbella shirazensis]NIK55792.1 hypothetical protein [Kribbella shirazensis]